MISPEDVFIFFGVLMLIFAVVYLFWLRPASIRKFEEKNEEEGG